MWKKTRKRGAIGAVEPFDFVPQLVTELRDLRPHINMFNWPCRVAPLVSTPPLRPAQHTIDHHQRIRANEGPVAFLVSLQAAPC